MPYFTCTRLNLYLDLLPVIGFQHFIALWKAYNKGKQIAQFLLRNCAQIFAQTPFNEMLLHICIRWVKGFSKMYNLLQFSAIFFAHFCLLNRFGFLQICHFLADY